MKRLFIIITISFLFSCAKEVFHTPNTVTGSNADAQQSFSDQNCAGSTPVRPPVDMLFLWDNSTSSVFLNSQAKAGLSSILSYVSERFDYNVMIAPLIGSGNNESVFFSRSGMSPGSGITTIQKSSALGQLSLFTEAQGSAEAGISRAVELLALNQSNQVFRKNAYTIVVILSNDDDNNWIDPNSNYSFNPQRRDLYVKGLSHDLLCLRGNYTPGTNYQTSFSRYNSTCSNAPSLDSTMMRVITVSALRPKASCTISTQMTENYVYKNVSQRVYHEPNNNDFTFLPAVVTSPYEAPDAFDICTGNYTRVFDSINNVIKDATLGHQYNFWPVASTSIEVDSNTMKITKSNGSILSEVDESLTIVRDANGVNDRDSNGNPVNGYKFMTGNNYVNKRFLPTPGEPYQGQVVELFGSAKVRFPECLLVQYSDEIKFYGYYQVDSRPDENNINIQINGKNIIKSSTNGWTLVKDGNGPKYLTNFNIRVANAGSADAKEPAVLKSGYFIKLNGSAVYKSGDTINVNYGQSAN